MVTGLMVLAFSVGLGRAWPAGPGAGWAPRLLGVYGVSLIAAGIFRADPAGGFPLGTPGGSISWHGLLHLAVGGIGFLAAAIACGLLGRRYRADGHRGGAGFSLLTGAVLLVGFALEASSGGSRTGTICFTAAVLLVWAWLSSVAVNRYREVGR